MTGLGFETEKMWTIAERAVRWTNDLVDAVDLDPMERYVPSGRPPGLTPSRHPVWKLPGLRQLSRPIRLIKGSIQERRSHKIFSVLERSGILFVHIPKYAGTSVADVLYGGSIGHHSLQFLKVALPAKFVSRAFSFAILREPGARLRSAFTYLKTSAVTAADMRFRDTHLSKTDDFSGFLNRLQDDPNFYSSVMRWHHFREQCAFIADSRGRLLVDAVFSMDRMDVVQQMLDAALSENRAIPRSNASAPQSTIACVPAVVHQIYGEDMRIFQRLGASPIGVLRTPEFYVRHKMSVGTQNWL